MLLPRPFVIWAPTSCGGCSCGAIQLRTRASALSAHALRAGADADGTGLRGHLRYERNDAARARIRGAAAAARAGRGGRRSGSLPRVRGATRSRPPAPSPAPQESTSRGSSPRSQTEIRERRRDDLRREPPRRHLRARLPGRGAREGACVLEHDGRAAIAMGRPAFRDGLALRARSTPSARARANGRRVVVIGAGPAGLTCAGELAALGYFGDPLRRARRAGRARPLAIAPYRQVSDPLTDEARALERLGVELRLGTRKRAASNWKRLP